MKSHISVSLLLCLIFIFAMGCSNKEPMQADDNISFIQESATVNDDIVENDIQPQDNATAIDDFADNDIQPQDNASEQITIDVDLTILSSTMISAEIAHIKANPDEYLGKTIKVSGLYSASYYPPTDQYYQLVTFEDANACCQQVFEFTWNGDHTYPDDYPSENTRIEMTGVFGKYEELGRTYYFLSVDDIIY